MDINELTKEIDALNRKSTEVNNTRIRYNAQRETLTSQCVELFNQYKTKYGVDLTPENLEEETKKVTEEMQSEVTKLEQVFASIEAGDYNHANALLGIEYQDSALKEALSAKGIDTNHIMQEREVMSRNYNEQPVANKFVEEVVTPPEQVNQGTPVAPIVQEMPKADKVVTPQPFVAPKPVATPTPQVQPAPPVAPKPAVSSNDDDFVAPPPMHRSAPSSPIPPQTAKPNPPVDGASVGGLFGNIQPEPPKKNSNASFEAMFGGSQFKGN